MNHFGACWNMLEHVVPLRSKCVVECCRYRSCFTVWRGYRAFVIRCGSLCKVRVDVSCPEVWPDLHGAIGPTTLILLSVHPRRMCCSREVLDPLMEEWAPDPLVAPSLRLLPLRQQPSPPLTLVCRHPSVTGIPSDWTPTQMQPHSEDAEQLRSSTAGWQCSRQWAISSQNTTNFQVRSTFLTFEERHVSLILWYHMIWYHMISYYQSMTYFDIVVDSLTWLYIQFHHAWLGGFLKWCNIRAVCSEMLWDIVRCYVMFWDVV